MRVMLILAALAVATESHATDAIALRDDFVAAQVRPPDDDIVFQYFTYWRNRNPNGVIELLSAGGVRLTVRRDALMRAALDGPGLYDRSELRESPAVQLPGGSAVWYRFSMRVPAEFPKNDTRFVAAQLKTSYRGFNDASPVFAIRFENRQLFATVEQSYDRRRDGDPRPAANGACPPGHGLAAFDGDDAPQLRVLLAKDASGLPPRRLRHYVVCTPATVVEHPAPLPGIGERPIDFLVFIKTGPAGRIELYADGKLTGVASGPFGDGDPRVKQYFKIGPYRDKADEPAALEFTHFRRGASRAEVSD
ncbi:MAG: heparin lyase I family protein [Proteobacteria bacterium]|nr:heparin lyase I family protein [Pseudomonadota bacterium]